MNRSKPQVISEILEICRNGANKTRIVYHANLNFEATNSYLQNLIEKDLLNLNNKEYRTTEKGKAMLESLNRIDEMLSNKIKPMTYIAQQEPIHMEN